MKEASEQGSYWLNYLNHGDMIGDGMTVKAV